MFLVVVKVAFSRWNKSRKSKVSQNYSGYKWTVDLRLLLISWQRRPTYKHQLVLTRDAGEIHDITTLQHLYSDFLTWKWGEKMRANNFYRQIQCFFSPCPLTIYTCRLQPPPPVVLHDLLHHPARAQRFQRHEWMQEEVWLSVGWVLPNCSLQDHSPRLLRNPAPDTP